MLLEALDDECSLLKCWPVLAGWVIEWVTTQDYEIRSRTAHAATEYVQGKVLDASGGRSQDRLRFARLARHPWACHSHGTASAGEVGLVHICHVHTSSYSAPARCMTDKHNLFFYEQ